MYRDEQTGGAVIITRVANGYAVTMPRKQRNMYAGMGEAIGPMIQKVRGDGDDDLERIRRENEGPEEKTGPEYEFLPVGNIFIFKEWIEVLAFLSKQMPEGV